jgi:hypothetical protein
LQEQRLGQGIRLRAGSADLRWTAAADGPGPAARQARCVPRGTQISDAAEALNHAPDESVDPVKIAVMALTEALVLQRYAGG